MPYRNRYCKAVEEPDNSADNPEHVGESQTPSLTSPLVDIDLALTYGTEPRRFNFERAFGPRTVIDLAGIQWDWVLSTWNPAHTEDPAPNPFFPWYLGITQPLLFTDLAYPPVAAEGAVDPVDVIHYYAPRAYLPGPSQANVHFLVRNAVLVSPEDLEIPDDPEGPVGPAGLATGNLFWFWNAAMVAQNTTALENSVEGIMPVVNGLAGRHLSVDTSAGPVTINSLDALLGSLGGVEFERWMHFWPPGSPAYSNIGQAIFNGEIATTPQGMSSVSIAVYSAPMTVAPGATAILGDIRDILGRWDRAAGLAKLAKAIDDKQLGMLAKSGVQLDDLIEGLQVLRDRLGRK